MKSSRVAARRQSRWRHLSHAPRICVGQNHAGVTRGATGVSSCFSSPKPVISRISFKDLFWSQSLQAADQ